MLNENFVYLGSVIAFAGSISYLADTLKGKVKPNRVSFLMWSLAPLVAFFAQLTSGVGISALFTFVMGISPLIILGASFINKEAEWKLSRFDLLCGGLSLLGFILYLISKQPTVAMIMSIAADGLASLPTLKKAYLFPDTESGTPYLGSAISAIITLLTLKSFNFINSSFLVYIILVCGAIFIFAEVKPQKIKQNKITVKTAVNSRKIKAMNVESW